MPRLNFYQWILVSLCLILEIIGVLAAPTKPAAASHPRPACFTRVRVTVPLDPYGLATRWKNTGSCSCRDAVARYHPGADSFKPQCNPDGTFATQQSTSGLKTDKSWKVNNRGDQLTEATEPWVPKQQKLSSGPYFLAPGG